MICCFVLFFVLFFFCYCQYRCFGYVVFSLLIESIRVLMSVSYYYVFFVLFESFYFFCLQMVKVIQVLRIYFFELEKVNEFCKDFCSRYIVCLKTKMNSEILLSGEFGSSYFFVQFQVFCLGFVLLFSFCIFCEGEMY